MTKEPKTQAHTEGWSYNSEMGFILNSNGDVICQMWDKNEDDYNDAENKANQIVKHHNSHQELVEALRAVKDYWDSGNFTRTKDLSSQVEQALKNTEEGE